MVGGLVAMALALACRRAEAPLTPDPVLAAELAAEAARDKQGDEQRNALAAMTLDDAAALEGRLQKNPDDTETRWRLLVFYLTTGRKLQARDDHMAASRRHALWFFEHAPAWPLLATARLDWDADPVSRASARGLWLSHVERPDAPLVVLNNATFFFEEEPAIAERLLRRMQTLPPDPTEVGTVHDRRITPIHARLGSLYASAIANAEQATTGVDAAFVRDVRATLASSRDAVLLAEVARSLAGGDLPGDPARRALQQEYLHRALAIDGRNPQVVRVREQIERTRMWEEVAAAEAVSRVRLKPDSTDGARAATAGTSTPVPAAPGLAACLAEREYMRAAGAQEQARLEKAKMLAEQALAAYPTLPRDRWSCDAPFRANLVLAVLALRRGDRDATLQFMRRAANAPASAVTGERRVFPIVLEDRLVNTLLKHGERETVADYLERASTSRDAEERARMRSDASAIRAGRMPPRYQRLLALGHI